MIKLDRRPKPVELTQALVTELTNKFKTTGENVYNIDFIKRELLLMSKDKCCYCEANISEESKYLEIEHYHDKHTYKDEVVLWDNLLPACKRCNGNKGTHDTKVEPIINPMVDYPQKHLWFSNYRIKGVDVLGKMTVFVLNINDQDRLVKKRFEIGNAFLQKLEDLNESLAEYVTGIATHNRRKTKIVRSTKELLRESLPSETYSASSSTIILTSSEFKELKTGLHAQGWWDDELKELEKELQKLELPINL